MPNASTAESPSVGKPLIEALREISIFSDLKDEQLAWFVSHAEEVHYNPNDVMAHEGDPADFLVVLLEGELRGRRESGNGDGPVFVIRAGHVTGMLPFSRLTHYPRTIRAVLPSRLVLLHKDRFPEMLEHIPQLLPRLVALMADRVRETSRADQQRDKLMALGKLSAGLAHELNNPASAARRSAEALREALEQLRDLGGRLDRRTLSQEQRLFLVELEKATTEGLCALPVLDSLAQSDREEEVIAWLDLHRIHDPWKLSAPLVEAGLDRSAFERISQVFPDAVLSDVLLRLSAVITAHKLLHEIESSTGRISELVRAVKEYSYMDQMPEQEIDIHQGIESTLTMLKFRLKKGVEVIREYDQSLPKLCAHGSELNQVWTNLIDNAIDAMNGKGQLRIRTSRELDFVLVEIIDNGPGIPPDIVDRIFDPFFTTKNVGDGTGLGLDTVHRIVRSHHGDVTVESVPGRTDFQIRLPFVQPKEIKQ
jgi:signal transduction histidine kinase